jgi:BMFP domain-containing protein YqiC
MRAGRKDGEPFADAVTNAFICLALWFRSQSLPVPFYSAELDRLQARIRELERAEDDRGIAEAVRQMNDPAWQPARATFAKLKESREECADLRDENARLQSRVAELEAAALTAVSRPVAPVPDAMVVEWTNDKLHEWLTAKHGQPTLNEDGDYAWPGCDVLRIGRRAGQNGDRPWCMADTHATRTLADALELTGAAP